MNTYNNVNLSPEERADLLIKEMTLQQKIGQMMCKMIIGDTEEELKAYPSGVGELIISKRANGPAEIAAINKDIVDSVMQKTGGIPPVIHVEAVTGMIGTGTTSFPSAIGLGATFAPEEIEKMTDIIRKQMMAVGNRRALSPVMDVARDPRWGRLGETYGEDPTLNSALSVAFVKGLQTDDLTEGVAATGKHFLGYAMGEGGVNGAFQFNIWQGSSRSIRQTVSGGDNGSEASDDYEFLWCS